MLFDVCTYTILKLKGSFDGLRLILIGDLHEQPVMHLKVKPFIVGAKDWSGEVRKSSALSSKLSSQVLKSFMRRQPWLPLLLTGT
jgi:hypothetical protein